MAKAPTEIRSLARSHTQSALNVLASIMNETSAPHAARVSAAQALLDRGWGKAVQAVELSGEIRQSVIRSPAVAPTAQDWSKDHAKQERLQ